MARAGPPMPMKTSVIQDYGSLKELAVSRWGGQSCLRTPLSSASSRLERRLRPGLAAPQGLATGFQEDRTKFFHRPLRADTNLRKFAC